MRTFTLFLLMLVSTAINAQIIHVPTVTYPTIQSGINAAQNGDTVLVADGSYYEQISFLGKAITVASNYIMDGDPIHIDSTTLDGSRLPFGNGSVVLFTSGEDTTSIINGFTIQHGKGTLDGIYLFGGGIYISNSGAKILNNRITKNNLDVTSLAERYCVGGAAIATPYASTQNWVVIMNNTIDSNECHTYLDDAAAAAIMCCYNARLISNTITHNSAFSVFPGRSFASIFIESRSVPPDNILIAENNVIQYNACISDYQVRGAGMFCAQLNAIFKGNNISFNEVSSNDSGFGGAGLCLSDPVNTLVEGNYFADNAVSNRGGAVHISRGPNSIELPVFVDNVFTGNQAQVGGAIFSYLPLVLNKNKFELNSSLASGGAIYLISPLPQGACMMENNTFMLNQSGKGGAIYAMSMELEFINNVFEDNYANADDGGAICLQKSGTPANYARFINNSFSGNKAVLNGGAIFSFGYNPAFINTIFYNDSSRFGSEINVDYGNASVAYSNLDPTKLHGQVDLYEGMMFTDPLFCDTTCLMPLCWSPCLNMGISEYIFGSDTLTAPLTDLNGAVRPLEDAYDLGAYEIDYSGIGVKKIENDFDVSAYPNPFNSRLYCHYRLEKESPVTVTIYNILGSMQSTWHQVQGPGEYNTPFELGMLQKGIYLLKIQIGDFIITRKVVSNE